MNLSICHFVNFVILELLAQQLKTSDEKHIEYEVEEKSVKCPAQPLSVSPPSAGLCCRCSGPGVPLCSACSAWHCQPPPLTTVVEVEKKVLMEAESELLSVSTQIVTLILC